MSQEAWFYAVAKERKGPVDTAALKQLAVAGVITSRSLIWKKGMLAWTPAGKIAGIIEATPPPLPEPEAKSGPPPLPSTQPVSSPPALPPKSSSGPPPLPPKHAGPPPVLSTAAGSPANLVTQLKDPKKLPWVIAGAAALVIGVISVVAMQTKRANVTGLRPANPQAPPKEARSSQPAESSGNSGAHACVVNFLRAVESGDFASAFKTTELDDYDGFTRSISSVIKDLGPVERLVPIKQYQHVDPHFGTVNDYAYEIEYASVTLQVVFVFRPSSSRIGSVQVKGHVPRQQANPVPDNRGYPPGYQPLADPTQEALRQQNIRNSEFLQNGRKAYSGEPITWTFPPANQKEADERARLEKMAAYNRSLSKSLQEGRDAFRPK